MTLLNKLLLTFNSYLLIRATKVKILWGLIAKVLLFLSLSSAANTVNVDEHFTHATDIKFSYTVKPLSLLQAKQDNNNDDWQQLSNNALNLGFTDAPVWIKVNLVNQKAHTRSLILSIDNPLLDNVAAYHYQGGKQLLFKEIGDALPLSNRQIKNESLLVRLILPANSETSVLLKVQSKAGVRVSISLWQEAEYLKYKSKFNLLYGLLVGFILALALINFVLYGFAQKKYFIVTGVIITTLWLLLIYLYGFGFRYFHPTIPSLQQMVIPYLLVIPGLFYKLLFDQICHPQQTKLQRIHTWAIRIILTSLLFSWLLPTSLLVAYCVVITPLLMLLQIFRLAIQIKRSNPLPCQYLLVGAIAYTLSIIYLCIVVFGLVKFNTRGLPVSFISFLVCAMSLSFAAIKHFLVQRDAKIADQQAQIAQSEAQDALLKERLALQEQARLNLEANIEERTFELQVALGELEEKNRALEQVNMEDSLTKIKNRRYFDKKLIMDLRRSRREQTPLSIIMLDIDHFKAINDSYGHLIGDQAIRTVADLIKSHLKRPLDEVARYGGEEFVVLLPNTPLEGAMEIAEAIREAITQITITVANNDITFTISGGVYSAIANDINNPGLFTNYADKALYHAKQHGRNRVVSFPILD